MSANLSSHLASHGPDAAPRSWTLPQARRFCAEMATGHYENFPVLTRVLPAELRPHFAAVYAYCRFADDLADEVADPAESLRLLDWWQDELDACYAGRTRHPIFVALAPTVERYGIPVQPFADLLDAFRQDQRVTRYGTFDELRDYCRRSADPVGRIVLHLFGAAHEGTFAHSDRICTGLQLANHWQDVGRDLARGRVYLPQEDLDRFGVEVPGARHDPTAFADLMRFEVDRAERWLRDGLPLVADLRRRQDVPARAGWMIALFAHGGLTVCRRIRAVGYRTLAVRPKVRKRDLPGLFWRAWRDQRTADPTASRRPHQEAAPS